MLVIHYVITKIYSEEERILTYNIDIVLLAKKNQLKFYIIGMYMLFPFKLRGSWTENKKRWSNNLMRSEKEYKFQMFLNIWQRGHIVEFLIKYIGCLALFISSPPPKKGICICILVVKEPYLWKNVVYSFIFHMFPEVFKIYL